MGKRYYWLKLKENFFNQKEIKRLRRLAGGDTFTIIYLKLLLLSLKAEGKIYFDGVGNDFIDELSLEIDEDAENIKLTLAYLQAKELLEVVNESEYFMADIPSMIGSESASASRVRRHRQKKELLQSNTLALQSNDDVTNCNTEIEIEIESYKEIELDKETDKDKKVDKENTQPIFSPDTTELERNILNKLQSISGYPFDYIKDLSFTRDLAVDYPTIDILEQVKKYSVWLLDNPYKAKSNPRLQFRNWCKNSVKWGDKKDYRASRGDETHYTGEEEKDFGFQYDKV